MKTNFESFGLSQPIITAIHAKNITVPSPIQEQLIPLILEGVDVIGQAQTGTGKTLAYTSCVLSKIKSSKFPKVIVLTPTRELAIQVAEEFTSLNTANQFRVLTVYGGSSIENQIRELTRGTDVIVGTPGRVLDLIKRKKMNLENLEYFILDEADEMLNMGFLEDIKTIFQTTNEQKQVLMLSATMPKEIKEIAAKYMDKNYKHIIIKAETKTSANVDECYYLIEERSRTESLCRILDSQNYKRILIFCQTKKECDELFTNLSMRGYRCEAMHGDITQSMRIQTLDRFKKGYFKILIATDVAARGIHVDNIDGVINYRLPQEFESYIHRIGRTGRAHHLGQAISLVSNRELKTLDSIQKFTKSTITKKEFLNSDEIISSKYDSILQDLVNNDNEEALKYVRDLSNGDLIKIAANLLYEKARAEIGSDFSKSIEIREKPRRINSEGMIRYFLTIGNVDGLRRMSLLDFLAKETNINKNNLRNIEVLGTYSFVDVDKNYANQFVSKMKNKKYNNRAIRVEETKKARN